jgi:hypothetical protein
MIRDPGRAAVSSAFEQLEAEPIAAFTRWQRN